jgi:hypothetical protein
MPVMALNDQLNDIKAALENLRQGQIALQQAQQQGFVDTM